MSFTFHVSRLFLSAVAGFGGVIVPTCLTPSLGSRRPSSFALDECRAGYKLHLSLISEGLIA